MDSQANRILNHFHDSMVGILSAVENVLSREAAVELLARVHRTFDIPTHDAITAEGTETARGFPTPENHIGDGAQAFYDVFIEKGGYSLKDHHILFGYSGKMVKPLAFGIVPPDATSTEYRLNFLMADTEELELNIRQLVRHSYNPNPAYGKDAPFTFFPDVGLHMTPYEYRTLVNDLQAFGVVPLVQALEHMNPWDRGKINDDVPTDTLVPLTDEERRTIQPIENVRFSYSGADEPLLRITSVDSGYMFHTATQSVEISARNIDVTFVKTVEHRPDGPTNFWLLAVSAVVRNGGVSLHDVMSLTEDDPRRARYLPLIDVFVAQAIDQYNRTKQ